MASRAVQPRPEAPNELVKFDSQIAERAGELAKALPSHISVDKFQRTLITAVQSDPALLRADRKSLVLACMKAAQDGLLPDKREAALVLFKENTKQGDQWVSREVVQYMPMVYGLRKKILQSGEVADIAAGVVYRRELESGAFVYEEGSARTLRHKPMMTLTAEEAADSEIIAAYSMATMKDGTTSFEVMRRFEIDKVRETSQTGATRDRRGQPRESKGPWRDWFAEMAKKTVMRRHAKVLPMSGDLIDVEANELTAEASAVHLLSTPPAAPTRQAIAEQAGAGNVIAHDPITGVIDDDDIAPGPAVAAQDEQDKPAAQAGDGDALAATVDAQESSLADKIEAQIAAANTIVAVSNVINALPGELTDEARKHLYDVANARKAAIRGEAA